jgi:hypothetical protein
MVQELNVPLYKSVGKKGKTVPIKIDTMEEYVEGIAGDAVWVGGTPTKTTTHHHTPPYTTTHHHTPPHTTTPPYTTVAHHLSRAPPHTFTGNHWLHAVATMFDSCVAVIIHCHKSAYLYGENSKRCIRLYKKDAVTHYDALVPAVSAVPLQTGTVAESSETGEWHYACSTPLPPLLYTNA